MEFPLFILTSYEDELYEQEVFDVYQIFDFERYLSEPQERVELHYKLIQQVVKYHKQLELWKKEIESLLPQKRIHVFLPVDCSDQELYEAIKPITKWRCEHANCAMQL